MLVESLHTQKDEEDHNTVREYRLQVNHTSVHVGSYLQKNSYHRF
jgi:hypothetical protein